MGCSILVPVFDPRARGDPQQVSNSVISIWSKTKNKKNNEYKQYSATRKANAFISLASGDRAITAAPIYRIWFLAAQLAAVVIRALYRSIHSSNHGIVKRSRQQY